MPKQVAWRVTLRIMDLPCIVTDINGSREIIENGVNGLIIPSKSTESLYQAMEKWFQIKK